MSVLVTNNGVGELLVGISDVETALVLRSNQGARFPAPIPGQDWFYITVQDSQGNLEVMKCTQRDGDTLTVIRAINNGNALQFNADSVVELRPCAELFNDKADADVLDAKLKEYEELYKTLESNLRQQFKALEATLNEKLQGLESGLAGNYLPLSGGRITGELIVANGIRTTTLTAESLQSGTPVDNKE